MTSIGLIGDYDARIPAHQAIPEALRLAAAEREAAVTFEWVRTDDITAPQRVAHFDGVWCVPGSPYRSMDGALLEYARQVVGWSDAEHAETAPDAARPVVSLLECTLMEATESIQLLPGTRIRAAYARDEIIEGYRCRYGLNQAYLQDLTSGDLRIAARSVSGEVRALELRGHPFFVTTLFQPERAALRGVLPPLVRAFVASANRSAR